MSETWRGKHPPGVIGVAHNGAVGIDLFRFMAGACLPAGTVMVDQRGSSGSIARQRNQIALEALEAGAQWVCYVDTDQVLSPTTIMQLLDTEKTVVSAVVLQRTFPYHTNAWRSLDPLARLARAEAERLRGPDGCVLLAAVGTGCLLVREPAFAAIEQPWFRLGEFDEDLAQEDVGFTLRAARAGHPPYLACDVVVGHRGEWTIWPGIDGRVWAQLDGPEDVRIPLPSLPDGADA